MVGPCKFGVDLGRNSNPSLASAIQSLNPSSFDTNFTRFPNVRLALSGGVWIVKDDSDRSDELERFRRGSSQCLFIRSGPISGGAGRLIPPRKVLYPFPILDYIRSFGGH